MTAMSKSRMHQELISKAQLKPKSSTSASASTNASGSSSITSSTATTVSTTSPSEKESDINLDSKVVERKKIVHDILEKQENKSETRRLNEQRRREFFESAPVQTVNVVEKEKDEPIVIDEEPKVPPRTKSKELKPPVVEETVIVDAPGKKMCSIS